MIPCRAPLCAFGLVVAAGCLGGEPESMPAALDACDLRLDLVVDENVIDMPDALGAALVAEAGQQLDPARAAITSYTVQIVYPIGVSEDPDAALVDLAELAERARVERERAELAVPSAVSAVLVHRIGYGGPAAATLPAASTGEPAFALALDHFIDENAVLDVADAGGAVATQLARVLPSGAICAP